MNIIDSCFEPSQPPSSSLFPRPLRAATFSEETKRRRTVVIVVAAAEESSFVRQGLSSFFPSSALPLGSTYGATDQSPTKPVPSARSFVRPSGVSLLVHRRKTDAALIGQLVAYHLAALQIWMSDCLSELTGREGDWADNAKVQNEVVSQLLWSEVVGSL